MNKLALSSMSCDRVPPQPCPRFRCGGGDRTAARPKRIHSAPNLVNKHYDQGVIRNENVTAIGHLECAPSMLVRPRLVLWPLNGDKSYESSERWRDQFQVNFGLDYSDRNCTPSKSSCITNSSPTPNLKNIPEGMRIKIGSALDGWKPCCRGPALRLVADLTTIRFNSDLNAYPAEMAGLAAHASCAAR
jgi:hypothetical protein